MASSNTIEKKLILVIEAQKEGFAKIGEQLASSLNGVNSSLASLQTKLNGTLNSLKRQLTTSFKSLGEDIGKSLSDAIGKSLETKISGVTTKNIIKIPTKLMNDVRMAMIKSLKINPADITDKKINEVINIPWNTKDMSKRIPAMKKFVEDYKKQLQSAKELAVYNKANIVSPVGGDIVDEQGAIKKLDRILQKVKVSGIRRGKLNISSSKEEIYSLLGISPETDFATVQKTVTEYFDRIAEIKARAARQKEKYSNLNRIEKADDILSRKTEDSYQNLRFQYIKTTGIDYSREDLRSMLGLPKDIELKSELDAYIKKLDSLKVEAANKIYQNSLIKSLPNAKAIRQNRIKELFGDLDITGSSKNNLDVLAALSDRTLGPIKSPTKNLETIMSDMEAETIKQQKAYQKKYKEIMLQRGKKYGLTSKYMTDDPLANLNALANLSNRNLGQIANPPNPPKPPKDNSLKEWQENTKALNESLGDLAGAGLGMVTSAWEKFMGVLKLGVGVIASMLGAIAGAAMIMKDWGNNILMTTERFRGYNIAMLGTLKTQAAVDETMKASMNIAEKLPIGYEQVFQGTKAMTLISPLKYMFKDSANLETNMKKVWDIVIALSQIEPEWGIQGALYSLRETLSGDFMSIKRRYEIPVDIMMTAEGKPLSDFKKDPLKLLGGLQMNLADMVPAETLEKTANQFSSVLQKIQGYFDLLKTRIGNMGFYDAFMVDMKKILKSFEGFMNSSESDIFAKRISNAFERAWSSVKGSATATINWINGLFGTGFKIDFGNISDNVASFVESVTHAFQFIEGILSNQKIMKYVIYNIEIFKTKIQEIWDVVKEVVPQVYKIIVDVSKEIFSIGKSIADTSKQFVPVNTLVKGLIIGWILGFENISKAILACIPSIKTLKNSFNLMKTILIELITLNTKFLDGIINIGKYILSLSTGSLSLTAIWKGLCNLGSAFAESIKKGITYLFTAPAIGSTSIVGVLGGIAVTFGMLPNLVSQAMAAFDAFDETPLGEAINWMKANSGGKLGKPSAGYQLEQKSKEYSDLRKRMDAYSFSNNNMNSIEGLLYGIQKKGYLKDFYSELNEKKRIANQYLGASVPESEDKQKWREISTELNSIELAMYNFVQSLKDVNFDELTKSAQKQYLENAASLDKSAKKYYQPDIPGPFSAMLGVYSPSNAMNFWNPMGGKSSEIPINFDEELQKSLKRGLDISGYSDQSKNTMALLIDSMRSISGIRPVITETFRPFKPGDRPSEHNNWNAADYRVEESVRNIFNTEEAIMALYDKAMASGAQKMILEDQGNYWNKDLINKIKQKPGYENLDYTKSGIGNIIHYQLGNSPVENAQDLANAPMNFGLSGNELYKAGMKNVNPKDILYSIEDYSREIGVARTDLNADIKQLDKQASIKAKQLSKTPFQFGQASTAKWQEMLGADTSVKFGQEGIEETLRSVDSEVSQIFTTYFSDIGINIKQDLIKIAKEKGFKGISTETATFLGKMYDNLSSLVSPFEETTGLGKGIKNTIVKTSNLPIPRAFLQMAGIAMSGNSNEFLMSNEMKSALKTTRSTTEEKAVEIEYEKIRRLKLFASTQLKDAYVQMGEFTKQFGNEVDVVFMNMADNMSTIAKIEFPQYSKTFTDSTNALMEYALKNKIPFVDALDAETKKLEEYKKLLEGGNLKNTKFKGISGVEVEYTLEQTNALIEINKRLEDSYKKNSPFLIWKQQIDGVKKQIEATSFMNPKAFQQWRTQLGQMNRETRQAYYSQEKQALQYGGGSGVSPFKLGMESAATEFGNWGELMMEGGETFSKGLATSFENNFFDVMTGKLGNLNDMFRNIGRSILNTIGQIISKMMAITATKVVLGMDLNYTGGGPSGGGVMGMLGSLLNFGGGSRGIGPNDVAVEESGFFGTLLNAGMNYFTGGSVKAGGGSGGGFFENLLSTFAGGAAGSKAASSGLIGGKIFGAGGSLSQLNRALFGSKINGGTQGFFGANPWVLPVAAAGMFLSQPGRLFGGTKDDTAAGRAAYESASSSRDEMVKRRLTDAEKYMMAGNSPILSRFGFGTVGYSEWTSGDGWFKGPKEKHSAADTSAFDKSMKDYYDLLKVSAESAYQNQKNLNELRKVNEYEALNQEIKYRQEYLSELQMKFDSAVSTKDYKTQDELRDKVYEMKTTIDDLVSQTTEAYKAMVEKMKELKSKLVEFTVNFFSMKYLPTEKLGKASTQQFGIFDFFDTEANKLNYGTGYAGQLKELLTLQKINTSTTAKVIFGKDTVNAIVDQFKEFVPYIFDFEGLLKNVKYDSYDTFRSTFGTLIDSIMTAMSDKLSIDNVIGEAKNIMDNLWVKKNPITEIFQDISRTTDLMNSLDKNDLVSGGAKAFADANLQLSNDYQQIADEINGWIDSGILIRSVTDTFDFTKEAFDSLQAQVRKSNFTSGMYSSFKGYMNWSDLNPIIQDYQNIGGVKDFENLSNIMGFPAGTNSTNVSTRSPSQLYSDPFAAYFEFTKEKLLTQIENTTEGSDIYFQAQQDLFNLMAERAEHLKAKSEDSMKKLEDLLNNIDATMKLRISEEAKTSKGDVVFLDLRTYSDMASEISKAIKNNDPQAMDLVDRLKKKLAGS